MESIPGEELIATATTSAAPLSGRLHAIVRRKFAFPRSHGWPWIGGSDISINMAYTSRAFNISTKDLAQYSQSGGQAFGIHVSNQGRVMVFAGIPATRGRKVLGGVGVNGRSESRDTP